MFTGQKVAIKILDKVKIIEEVGIERVLREIKISSELNHPNIIKIYKILEDDRYYLSYSISTFFIFSSFFKKNEYK